MRSGQLRHEGQLQSPTKIRGETGGYTLAWSTYARVCCGEVSSNDVRGSETVSSEKIKAEKQTTWLTRFRPGVTSGHRLIVRGRTLNIESVNNVNERDRELMLYCREQV